MINSKLTEADLDALLKPYFVPLDEYEVNKSVTLGTGMNGSVLLATRNDKEYAIKNVLAPTDEVRLSVKRNLVLYSNLDHKNLVKFVSYDILRGVGKSKMFAIVMEKAQTSLSSYMIDNPMYFNDINHLKQFMFQMFSIFNYFEIKTVVHGDVKPPNILLDRTSPEVWKVADLSFAKDDSTNIKNTVSSAAFLGTREYMAPEVRRDMIKPGEKLDWKKCDVFSLGLVFLAVCGVNSDENINEGSNQEVATKISPLITKIFEKYKDTQIVEIIGLMLQPNPKIRLDIASLQLFISCQSLFTPINESSKENELADKTEAAKKMIQDNTIITDTNSSTKMENKLKNVNEPKEASFFEDNEDFKAMDDMINQLVKLNKEKINPTSEMISSETDDHKLTFISTDDVKDYMTKGDSYRDGRGVAVDNKMAMEWYLKAAAQGDSDAQYNIGCFYDHGEGVAIDKKIAMEWYLKAAAQGHSSAQYNSGNGYFNGDGVAIDKQAAME
jgi:serine/threonine protein kinase